MIDIETGLPSTNDPFVKLVNAVKFLLHHHANPAQVPDKKTAQQHLDNLTEITNVPSGKNP